MRLLIALKILLRLVVGVIFTPIALRGTRRDLARLVAPRPPAQQGAAAPPAPSSLAALGGILEDANQQGVKLQDLHRWIDYGKTFQGNKVSKADIGKSVELLLIQAKSGAYVRSIRVADLARPGQVPAPRQAPVIAASPKASGRKASANQIAYAQLLRRQGGNKLSEEDLESLSQLRFKKGFGSLSEPEMSQMITLLGGYPKRHDRQRV